MLIALLLDCDWSVGQVVVVAKGGVCSQYFTRTIFLLKSIYSNELFASFNMIERFFYRPNSHWMLIAHLLRYDWSVGGVVGVAMGEVLGHYFTQTNFYSNQFTRTKYLLSRM